MIEEGEFMSRSLKNKPYIAMFIFGFYFFSMAVHFAINGQMVTCVLNFIASFGLDCIAMAFYIVCKKNSRV